MASLESTTVYYRVYRTQSTWQQQQHQPQRNVKPTDLFKFEVTADLRCCTTDSNSHPRRRIMIPLFQASIFITCESFFGDNHDFLRRNMSDITNSPYITPECLDSLDLITERIKPLVQQLFDLDHSISLASNYNSDIGLEKSLDSENRVFPLVLEIIMDVMEESMQDVRMIPASKEAIQSLKTYKLPEQCHICKEKFHGESDDDDDDDDDDVEFTPIPCGHGFHHQCIVQWLQINHTCPICRYPMPTANN